MTDWHLLRKNLGDTLTVIKNAVVERLISLQPLQSALTAAPRERTAMRLEGKCKT